MTLADRGWRNSSHNFFKDLKDLSVSHLWADCRDKALATDFAGTLKAQGFSAAVRPICGRSPKDQVWWKRWVVTGTTGKELPFDWTTSDDEPCTPPWMCEDATLEHIAGKMAHSSLTPPCFGVGPKEAIARTS